MSVNSESLTGYQIADLIGRGRYTSVYDATQISVNRRVVIKILDAEIADHPEFIRHFEDYRTITRLKHANIAPLYDYWREPSSAFFVMPRYERSLEDELQKGAFSLERTTAIVMQIGEALALAHRNGVLHHNLKPSNILFDSDDVPYLSDFHIIPNINLHATIEDTTHPYHPPERSMDEQYTKQSEIYSLGVIAYAMLTGSPDLEQGAHPSVPTALNDAIKRATDNEPSKRYPDMASFMDAFQSALSINAVDMVNPTNDLDQVASTALDKFIKGSSGIRWRIIKDLEKRIENPYKGLNSFEEDDASNFFGREAMTETLINKLNDKGSFSRFLAVVGPSGSGKSSLIKAGLIPTLRRGVLPDSDKWFFAELMPKTHPLNELRVALLSVARNKNQHMIEQLQSSADGLTQVVDSILGDGDELVLLIDQFEEIFTMVDSPAQSNHFMELLYHAVTVPDSRIRVIITLRADFYDRPLMHPLFCDLIADRTVVVPPLTANELHRAIVSPLNDLDMTIDDELISLIIDEVKEQPGTLPMLQYALTRLFEKRDGKRLTVEAYQEIGGILGSLTRQADELYYQLNNEQQIATQQLFLRLVTLGEGTEDTRKQALQSELISIGGDAMREVFEIFGASRLITFNNDSITREPTVEVAHEALIKQWMLLRQWLDSSRDDLRQQKQLAGLANEWIKSGKDSSFLASGSRLDQLEQWFNNTTLSLSENEKRFVEASLSERDRLLKEETARQENKRRLEQRARRLLLALTIASVLGAVVAIVLSLFALNQSYEASIARQESELNARISHELTMLSNSQLLLYRDNNTDLALALALEAQKYNYLPEQEFRILTETMYAPGTRKVITGHEGRLYESDLNADKTRLVTGSNDNTVRIWGIESSAELQRFEGHEDSIMQVTYSPDDRLLASASLDGTVRIWDVATGETLHTLNGDGDPNGFLAVEFSPDGGVVVTGSQQNTIQFWDVESGELINTFAPDDPETETVEGHSNWVWGLTFSEDGTRLLSGGREGLGLLWDIASAEILQTFTHTDAVYQLKFSDDEEQIYTASADKSAKVWDVETGEALLSLDGHTSAVYSIVVNADETRALTASQDGSIRLWKLDTGTELHNFVGHQDRVFDARFLANEQQFVSSSYDGTVRVWDIETPQSLEEWQAHQSVIYSVGYDHTGNVIISTAGDSIIHLWDAQSLENIMTLREDDPATDDIEGHSNLIVTAKMSRDESRLVSSDGETVILLWDLPSGEVIRVFPMDDLTTEEIEGHVQGEMIWNVAFSPDDQTIYSSAFDNRVIQWDANTGEIIHVYEGHTDGVLGVVPLSDGRRFLSFSWDGTINLWDNQTHEIIRTYDGHGSRIWAISVSPDETTFVSASEDTTMILWDIETGAMLKQFFGHDDAVLSVDFSVDGNWLVSSGRDNRVLMWAVETGEWLREFVGNQDWVRSIDYHPFENRFITGDNQGFIRVWHAQNIEEIKTWAEENRYIKELTCEERNLYRVEPLCPPQDSER